MTKNRGYWRGGILAAAAGAIMAATAGGAAYAQSFPDHDITFVVPYSPGGGSDQQARRLQKGLEEALGVGIRIVYKTGGGGAVGFLELHSSEPDGYTIANVVVPNIIVTSQGDDVGFKPEEFAYIGMTDQAVGAFVVPKQSEFQTLEELIAYAKENPGKLTVSGVGATGQANFAMLVDGLGIEATYVPVSGGVGKIMPLLQGGHVDASLLASSHATRHKETVRTLAVAGQASPALADVPTFESLGYPTVNYATTWGVMAPPGTPDDIVAVLNDALNKAVADPAVKEMQIGNGLTPMSMSPEEAKQFVLDNLSEVDRKAKLVEEQGLN